MLRIEYGITIYSSHADRKRKFQMRFLVGEVKLLLISITKTRFVYTYVEGPCMSMNFLSPTKQTSSFFRIYQRDKHKAKTGICLS